MKATISLLNTILIRVSHAARMHAWNHHLPIEGTGLIAIPKGTLYRCKSERITKVGSDDDILIKPLRLRNLVSCDYLGVRILHNEINVIILVIAWIRMDA